MGQQQKPKEGTNDLKIGFKYSLVALTIFLVYVALTLVGVASILLFSLFLPFLILCTWAYGLYRRIKGWGSLGKKSIAHTVAALGIVVFLFFFPITNTLIYWMIILIPPFPIISYAVVLVPLIAWGIYTFCESQGMRWLKETNEAKLNLSRAFSLAGVFVYFVTFLILYLLPGFPTQESSSVQVYEPYTVPLLLACPLLMASCIVAIRELTQARLKGEGITG